MNIHFIDLIIIAGYLLLTLAMGLFFSKRGTKNIREFFATNRSMPWWLAGTTMVASAFAIDTPLGITGMVAQHGIPGVWYAWSFVLGGAGMLGAFVFSSMLNRSGILSTAEIAELRYYGRSAAVLRGFKGVYFGILANAVTLGWIIKAVWTLSEAIVPDFDSNLLLGIILAITLVYTAASGLWGIAATDFVQFIIGSAGSLLLAWFAWRHIGGPSGLVEALTERYGEVQASERLRFFPTIGTPFFTTFMVFITLKWWGNPPPAILQRIIAAKDEKHASSATFLFTIVAFGFNYWPMIFAALVSLAVYPDLATAQAETGYAKLITDLMPVGILGLMLASLIAAFMSTVDTHLNYGAAFMVNDLYKRFVVKNASDSHYVKAAQISTVIMLIIALLFAFNMDSVSGAWYYMSMLTAGYGIVAVVRWFWWRVNAWSEIAALLASFIGSTMLSPPFARLAGYEQTLLEISWPWRFVIIVAVCTVTWILVTFITKPTPQHHLTAFCKKVKPFRVGWKPVAAASPDIVWREGFFSMILRWGAGCVATFAFCFSIGNLMFGRFFLAALLFSIAAALALALFSKRGAEHHAME